MEGTFSVRPSVCFEVQKITAVSIGEGNQRNYQVQWAPTWISSINLVGCEHLIEEFICQQSGKGQVADNTTTATDPGCLQVDVRDDSFETDFDSGQQQYKEDIYKRPSMVVNEVTKEHLFENHERNSSSSYDNEGNLSSSYDDKIVRVIPVTNGGMVTSELYRDHEKNPNFEWVENDESFHVYNDPLVDVNNGECDVELDLNKEAMHREKFDSVNLFHDDALDEEIVVVREPASEQTSIQVDTTFKDDTSNKPQKIYECEICHKAFGYSWGLKRHFNNVHGVRNKSKCVISSKKVESEDSLVKRNSKPSRAKLKCRICGKLFFETVKLTAHMRTHTELRSFECHLCEKKFKTSTELRRHIRVHTNERPFECKTCKERFKLRHHLKKHILKHAT